MGKRALYRVMGPYRQKLEEEQQDKLKAELLGNYKDHLFFKKLNKQNNIKLPTDRDDHEAYKNLEPVQRFISLSKTKNSKPYWANYSQIMDQNQRLLTYLPDTFRIQFSNR